MDPITLGAVAVAGSVAGVVGVVGYFEERGDLKKGDISIHEEAEKERESESVHGVTCKNVTHCLHPQHELEFVQGGMLFVCNACLNEDKGNRYSCRECDFDLHEACAISDDMLIALTAEESKHNELVHPHPLSLVEGLSYICGYCNNQSDRSLRYYCAPCDEKFDTVCVNHSARLSSFFHPQHELELKTKRHFKKCSVCSRGGVSNARVYSCEQCEFYVHPSCAMGNQYIQHPLHAEHKLVFTAVASDNNVACKACDKECKQWCYLCPVCRVYFHPSCIEPSTTTPSDGFIENPSGFLVKAIFG